MATESSAINNIWMPHSVLWGGFTILLYIDLPAPIFKELKSESEKGSIT